MAQLNLLDTDILVDHAAVGLEAQSRLYTGNRKHFEFVEGLIVQNPPYRAG